MALKEKHGPNHVPKTSTRVECTLLKDQMDLVKHFTPNPDVLKNKTLDEIVAMITTMNLIKSPMTEAAAKNLCDTLGIVWASKPKTGMVGNRYTKKLSDLIDRVDELETILQRAGLRIKVLEDTSATHDEALQEMDQAIKTLIPAANNGAVKGVVSGR